MKKTYYHSKAEIHYRMLVQQRREHISRSKDENDFKNTYGKWPTSLELLQFKKNRGYRDWNRGDK